MNADKPTLPPASDYAGHQHYIDLLSDWLIQETGAPDTAATREALRDMYWQGWDNREFTF